MKVLRAPTKRSPDSRTYVTAIAAVGLFTIGGSATALAAPQRGADVADASAVSRLKDGSFEKPTAPANSFVTVSAGQPIGPWKVTRGGVDLIGAGFWPAAEGAQSVDLNATKPGTVAQTFSTRPGRAYTTSPQSAFRRSVSLWSVCR